MISYLKGSIQYKSQNFIVLNVGNVGYQVHIPRQIYSEATVGKEREFFIYTHVREDQLTLFGFETLEELQLFKLVLSVSGIGPKIGLEILSTPSSIIKNAILNEDTKTLAQIPGLGLKTSKRLILELKNKIEPLITYKTSAHRGKEEAIEALSSLGYSKPEIFKILNTIEDHLEDPEAIVRYFFKNV